MQQIILWIYANHMEKSHQSFHFINEIDILLLLFYLIFIVLPHFSLYAALLFFVMQIKHTKMKLTECT